MEIEYKNSLVGFVDVMGFKNLLSDTDSNKKTLAAYFKEIEQNKLLMQQFGEKRIAMMTISDSIIYSLELTSDEKENLELAAAFLGTLASIQYNLAALHSIWTRGAISVGKLYMNAEKNIVVGQAFVDAYMLERVANYPRIIIDPKIFAQYQLNCHEFCTSMRTHYNVPIMNFIYNSPIDYSPWPNDYAQLDWFGLGLDQTVSVKQLALEMLAGEQGDLELNKFFENLNARQNESPEIFIKSQLLIRYLLQSFYEFRTRDGDLEKPHVKSIAQKLTKISGFQLGK